MPMLPASDNYVSGFGSKNLAPSDVHFENRRWLDQQAAAAAINSHKPPQLSALNPSLT